LSDVQKLQRVDQARLLLRLLQPHHDRAWYDIVTLDESWFYFTISHEFIRLPQGEKVPERERSMIGSEQFMVTIVWDPMAFT
jgi:hypothetical protein